MNSEAEIIRAFLSKDITRMKAIDHLQKLGMCAEDADLLLNEAIEAQFNDAFD